METLKNFYPFQKTTLKGQNRGKWFQHLLQAFNQLLLILSFPKHFAVSAARQRDSGSPPQFGTFSPFGSAQFRPRPSSAQSPCPSSNSAPPVLSPQRKGSRSARLCCSFRRTLRRGSPAKRLLVQSDSNQSAPAAGVINLREQAASAEKKDSAASITLSAQEESHLLAKAWQQQQRKVEGLFRNIQQKAFV